MLNLDGKISVNDLYRELTKFVPPYQAKEFLSFLLKIDYRQLHLYFDETIELIGYKKFITRKVFEGYPIPYVIKSREFYGHDFYVDERVLIPRHETEILLEEALKLKKDNCKVLDICTGSGALLVSYLLHKTDSKGLGVDISFPALEVAKINLVRFNLLDRGWFVCLDALNGLEALKLEAFDIILCNPPYISKNEKLPISVMYEPSVALFAEDDGFAFYKKLLRILSNSCKENAVIFFEIGIGMSQKLREIFKGEKIEFIKDYAGVERVLKWINSK